MTGDPGQTRLSCGSVRGGWKGLGRFQGLVDRSEQVGEGSAVLRRSEEQILSLLPFPPPAS